MPTKSTTTTDVPRTAYSPGEFAAAFGWSRQFVYKLMAAGQLQSVLIGRSRRIPASEAARLLGGTDAA